MSSVTERRGTIGVVKGSGENESFQAKANFSLKIVAKVEGTKDGYIARVTWAPDNASRWVQCLLYTVAVLKVVFLINWH